ncbi:MAG: hypothetical protein ABFR65_07200, partial [Pseudomonadota bacterium]
MPRPKKQHKRRAGWWFLLAAIALHLAVRLIDPRLSEQSLDYFVQVLIRLLPAFGLMFLLLCLFNLFAKPQQIKHWLGELSGPRGWVFAILGGVISMGSMYLWYPLLKDLKAQGMRTSLLAAFLYSRAVKIPMLPFMVHYFGALYTGLFVVNILLFSVLSGSIMERLDKRVR